MAGLDFAERNDGPHKCRGVMKRFSIGRRPTPVNFENLSNLVVQISETPLSLARLVLRQFVVRRFSEG